MPEENVEALWYLDRPGHLHHAETASSILQCMRPLCSTVRVDGAQAGKVAHPLSFVILVLQDYRCWLEHERDICHVGGVYTLTDKNTSPMPPALEKVIDKRLFKAQPLDRTKTLDQETQAKFSQILYIDPESESPEGMAFSQAYMRKMHYGVYRSKKMRIRHTIPTPQPAERQKQKDETCRA